jgi:TIR domain
MKQGTIFVSHRAEYASLVRELKKAIETTSRGKIQVFISEDLPGAEKWRAAIKSQLKDAESLFLVYGAAYEDWSWCFYEAGFFAGIDAAQKQSRRTYCIARPNVPPPGPLNDLQVVTDVEQLITDLIDIYDRNSVIYDAAKLRDCISQAAKGLFGKLEEFVSYPRVYFIASAADFGQSELPSSAVLRGDRTVLTQLFGIGRDEVRWSEITSLASVDRTSQERLFFCKWIDETKKIILAARENRFIAPQTVLIVRGGMRYRFLLYQARIQGDGSYCCEFLVINEVGGPALGLSQQQLALLTSIRLGFRLRYELFRRFPNDFTELSNDERGARIQEIPRLMDSLTAESDARGNMTLQDLQGAFNDEEADRIGRLAAYWPILKDDLYDALGLSRDGNPVSDRGLMGPNLEKYRLAFEALQMINTEFLSRSCSRISQMMMRPDNDLKRNAELIESNVRTLSRMHVP